MNSFQVYKTLLYNNIGKPNISAEEKQFARLGNTGKIVCDIFAIPRENEIIWYKNGEIVSQKEGLVNLIIYIYIIYIVIFTNTSNNSIVLTTEEMLSRTRSKLTIMHVSVIFFLNHNTSFVFILNIIVNTFSGKRRRLCSI